MKLKKDILHDSYNKRQQYYREYYEQRKSNLKNNRGSGANDTLRKALKNNLDELDKSAREKLSSVFSDFIKSDVGEALRKGFSDLGNALVVEDLGMAVATDDTAKVLKSAVVGFVGITVGAFTGGIGGAGASILAASAWDYFDLGKDLSGESFRDRVSRAMEIALGGKTFTEKMDEIYEKSIETTSRAFDVIADKNTDWSKFGDFVYDSLIDFADNIDNPIYNDIRNKASEAIEMVLDENTDWSKFGDFMLDSLIEFTDNIDNPIYNDIRNKASEAIEMFLDKNTDWSLFDDFLIDSAKDGWNWFTANLKDWFGILREDGVVIYDPLTLDLDGDGIETVASNGHKGALFDHSNDGIRTATGWINKDDGLLVYDRNGDGVVNNGGELFGDNTLLKNGERAANGYQALADLDDNGDGKVDAADSAFAKLRVWRDLNQDGISQEGELLTLNEAKVKALNLANKNSDRDLGNGNSLAEEGTYTDSDGNEKQMGDLNLAADHFHSRYADSLPLTDEQQQASNLRGSGRVRDLREAAARSPELAEALQQYKNAATKEEQLTLRHENTAKTPGELCHKYAKTHMTDSLQSRNGDVWFPQRTTQKPHNNTLFSWKTNI